MDTSETYIKMCEKAEEIQKLSPRMATRIHTKRNIYICSDYDNGLGGFFYCMDTFSDEEPAVLEFTRFIWLPRQDQLQEMMQKNLWSLCNRIGELCEFGGYPYGLIGSEEINSMEQLWLAFVMSERYSKKWDGTEWR